MSPTATGSTPRSANVYYLAAQTTTVEPLPRPSRWLALHGALNRAWWRFRITLAEIRNVLHRSPDAYGDDYPVLMPDDVVAADTARSRFPRSSVPARVIDLAAARGRLRPLAQG